MTGIEAIAAERQRQIDAEGWTPKHDDEHTPDSYVGIGDLVRAAICYAFAVGPNHPRHYNLWPWDAQWWKPSDRRRNLVKAGALIAAEIDRLDRANQEPTQ